MQNNGTYNPGSNWRILRDTAILSGVGSLFTFVKPLRAIVLGRILGPYSYGLLNVPLPYVQILSIFANMGLSAALLRMLALRLGKNDPAAARSLVKTGLSLALASSVLWSIVLSLLSPLLAERFASEPAAVVLIAVGAWMIPGITLIAVLSNIFLAYDRGPLLGAVKSIYSILGLILPVVFVLLFKQPLHVLIAFVLVESATAVIAYIHLYRRVLARSSDSPPDPAERLGPLLKLAHSFFYTNLGWMLINSVDRIMIQWYRETEVLGFYAVAVFFVNFLNIIPMNFSQVITPTLTKSLARSDLDAAWHMVRQTTRVVSLILAPLVVFSAVFSDEFVIAFFSSAFAPAGLFLRILAFIALLNFVCKLCWSILVSDKDPGTRSIVYIIAAVLNIALNLLLIPRFGGAGAAAASLLSFVVLAAALQMMLYRTLGKWLPFGQIVPAFCVAAVALPVWLLLPPWGAVVRLAAGLLISFALYIALCCLAGLVRRGDLRHLTDRSGALPGPLPGLIRAAVSLLHRIAWKQ